MNRNTTRFITATAIVGIAVIVAAIWQWQSQDLLRFGAYLIIALLASGLKVVLPGINGTMSVNFLFILLGVLELSFSETVIIGCAATLVQCFYKMSRPTKAARVLFNVCSMMAPAIAASYWVYHHSTSVFRHSMPLMLMAAGCTFFLTNTVPIAVVISLAENRPFRKTWAECYFWSFPYYLAGAALVAMISYLNRYIGWQTSLLILPIVYWVYRSYRLYLGRLADEKRHVEDMASLHLRTIEALALAIDAKDHATHDHLQRVRVYALEIGKELGLGDDELEALKAAALLHDIGKLAVPEHIINKPGRLTAEEFEKVKIHPVVGAEILERVQFPYAVVPIVRSHHEKWDGSGYPDGLKGEEIPIGARVLTAVDCLDALASDRQYRRALPLDEAMDYVASLGGKEFDPQVVDILKRRYIELERMAQTHPTTTSLALSTDVKVERGSAPAAGFEKESQSHPTASDVDFLISIAAARQEAQMLFELTHDLGNSLSLDETLSVVSVRLGKLVPYDAIAIWVRKDEAVVPKYVTGDNCRLFSSLEIPLGQGLSGWVVQNHKSVLNGNPSVEAGYLNDPSKLSTLRSALAVPLEGVSSIIGALTLYRTESDAFNKDHLRVLLAISSKIALSVENALKFQQAQSSATTDFLTELPNARSLFLHLDGEVARSKRTHTVLAVMVCDLNGFKSINDRYGHIEGNKVLRLFAQALKKTCREYDYVARMGGDEFVIVAPGLTPEAAKAKAEAISGLAVAAGQEICGGDLLSASVGTAFFLQDGTDVEQLLAEADRRMYMVKQRYHEREASMAKFSAGPYASVLQ
jgi:diguanylate cyclase (GGDEF)-like protein/putative nucleotidyltransferase with HDIG domain